MSRIDLNELERVVGEAKDQPTVLHPVVRKLEQEAIALYRAKYPDAPPWQELAGTTRHMWVAHAEKMRALEPFLQEKAE